MKRFTTYIIFLICPFFFFSCTKDNISKYSKSSGQFSVSGIPYDLHEGSVACIQPDAENIYIHGFVTHSTGIQYKCNYGYSGKGSAVQGKRI